MVGWDGFEGLVGLHLPSITSSRLADNDKRTLAFARADIWSVGSRVENAKVRTSLLTRVEL